MKQIFNPVIAIASVLAIISAGCSAVGETKSSANSNSEKTLRANADIRGQWYIDNIVFSDTDNVRPAEAAPGARQYIIFEDSTYYIMTNCNSISGGYKVKGNSITLGDGPMTGMACDNMETEDALRRILPHISKFDMQNDSVLRLNTSTPSEYILLRKASPEIK